MEELEVLLKRLFFHLGFWQTVWRNLKQIRREDYFRYRRARSQFVKLVTPKIHKLAIEFRCLSFKDLDREGGTFFVNRYTPDEVEAEKYRCPKNRLRGDKTEEKLRPEQGVHLELRLYRVDLGNAHVIDESEVDGVPELVPNLDEVDREWMEMVARFTSFKVAFL